MIAAAAEAAEAAVVVVVVVFASICVVALDKMNNMSIFMSTSSRTSI